MKRNRIPPGILILLMIITLLCEACGKKDDPMPPQVKVPKIADLGGASAREGIVLGWSLTGPVDGVAGFKLLRSEIAPGSQGCLTCPQVYRPYVTVTIADDRLHREGERKFRYIDTDVKVGGSYSYRIAACDHGGYCGEASNESAVIYVVP